MVLDIYSQYKKELIDCLREAEELEGNRSQDGWAANLLEKIENNVFHLVVLGQFKRGKTSLINALLGTDLLPTAIVPLTSIATVLQHGQELKIEVHFLDGRAEEIHLAALPQYVTEKGNPKNEKGVQEVVIAYPSAYLRDGVRLIDTPGVGSVFEHNTDVAYEYLPKADAALFLLSVDQPVSKAELEFLQEVKEYSHRIFFLQNKADYVERKDLAESMDFAKKILEETLGGTIRIFPVSAKLALQGKMKDDPALLRASFLPEFEQVLNNFLMEEKGRILLLSVGNNLLRFLSQFRFGLELEMKSLLTPQEELMEKIQVFEKKKEEVLSEKEDFQLLLDGAVKQIAQNVLEEDLTVFRRNLGARIWEKIENDHARSPGVSLRELQHLLEKEIIEEVKSAFSAWRAAEDRKLADAFEAVSKRFLSRVEETVDALLHFSAELFSVPFDRIQAESLWSSQSRFYYRFQEQPGAIEIVASSLALMLPKFIGGKILFKRMKEYLHRVIDLQAARIGSDFEQRLDKSKLDFRWEMFQRIEATLEGISQAIEKGRELKTQGAEIIEEQKRIFENTVGKIEAIRSKVIRIRQALSEGGSGSLPG